MLLVVLLLLLRLWLLTVEPMLLSSMVLHMLLLRLLMLVIGRVLLLAAASILLWEVRVRRLELLLLLVLGDHRGRDGRGRCLLRLMVLLLVCRRVEQIARRWLLLARRGITATSARQLMPDDVDISAIIVVVIRLLMLLWLLIDYSATIL